MNIRPKMLWGLAAIAVACLSVGVACGSSSEPSDEPDVDTGAADTSGSACPMEADGGCVCDYQGEDQGVCADAEWNEAAGACAEPADYESEEKTCADGLDNDCDGLVDCDDVDCAQSACIRGKETATCVDGSCQETSCGNGVDDDEDGITDCLDPDCEGRSCDPETDGATCPPPDKVQEDEACDGADNDCDGETDEGLSRECTKTEGVCAGGGDRSCQEGSFPSCAEAVYGEDYEETESSCDGKDNDCDGVTGEWGEVDCVSARMFGTGGSDDGTGIAVAKDGSLYAVGSVEDAVGGETYNGGASDAVVLKYAPTGERQWVRLVGTSAEDRATDVVVGSTGAIYVTGRTTGDLAGNTNSGLADAFLAKLSASSGALQGARLLGTPSQDGGTGLAADPSGPIYVSGWTEGDLGGRPSAAAKRDGFVAKFAADGTEQWIEQFGSSEYDFASGVDTDTSGSVYAVGFTAGDLHAGSETATHRGGTGNDAFLVKFDASGTSQWIQTLGSTNSEAAWGVAATGTNTVYVTGVATGPIDGKMHKDGPDIFLAKFDSMGARTWLRLYGTSGSDSPRSVSVDGSGSVFVGGTTNGALGGEMPSGRRNGFVVTYDASGKRDSTSVFGTSADDYVREVAPAGDGNAFVVGRSARQFGWQSYSGGNYDGFVAIGK